MIEPMSSAEYDLWIDFAALGCAAVGTLICVLAGHVTRRTSRRPFDQEWPAPSSDRATPHGASEPAGGSMPSSTRYTLRHAPMGFSAGPHSPRAQP